MTEDEGRAFEEICRKFAANDELTALQELRDLAGLLSDPWDKAWLNYQEIRFLVDMRKAEEARTRLEELKALLATLIPLNSPTDGYELDAPISLQMLVSDAEIRVKTEEGKETEALHLAENFFLQHPKQLLLPEFKDLGREVATLCGILLGNAGRWNEAMHVLEAVTPPPASRSQHAYYLGRSYFEGKRYKQAKDKLEDALNLGLESAMIGRAHYVLGLAEYHLSGLQAAKREFELSLKTTDPAYLGDDIWGWLEATSRSLGLQGEAEKYRRMRTDLASRAKPN